MKDSRHEIRAAKFLDEAAAVQRLLEELPYVDGVAANIEENAAILVTNARSSEHSRPLLDTFLAEYGLSNSEGVALMCLAESLLRVPDWDTADLLIADKLHDGAWDSHAGHANSMLVNASTWALMLTGRLVELDNELVDEPVPWFKKLIARLSEPVVQAAIRTAMEILGREFVLGETIEKAIKRCQPGALYSFDMLGEAARDARSADRYFESYLLAIDAARDAMPGSSISIKLSALHPRYETAQKQRVVDELVPRVAALCKTAASAGISIAIDAEEADRLELSLDVLQALVEERRFENVGFVVQAYSKRAPCVLDWLVDLAGRTQTVISIRLVKGAYWDAEIKHAQVEGHSGFPVYTRKEHTDLAYLHCAKKIFDHPAEIYGQFATHNAHTIAAVLEMGHGRQFEFQRLHGMGEKLFATAVEVFGDFPDVRVYAPVGHHEDLLAYLVRRLLENGANSSFVNRFLDETVSPSQLVADPVRRAARSTGMSHPRIRMPMDLYGDRLNSNGIDFSDAELIASLEGELIERRKQRQEKTSTTKRSPIDSGILVGDLSPATVREADAAIERALSAQPDWNKRGNRGAILKRVAELLEQHRIDLFSLLVDEAGKTLPDAVSEVREAVDFCRYYAGQVETALEQVTALPGPTGEKNDMIWQGRGVWACISPWNFPLAIFLGQVSAALAAGNSVIAKPAEETPLIAARCVDLLHEAGVPEEVCWLAIGDGGLGQYLVEHPDIAGVAFTGGTETARHINIAMASAERPIVPLIAETGGQNAMLVDSTALLEQVTDDVIDSAFRSAGQRCSALRVLFLQEEIADAAVELIIGAMNELSVGDPIKLSTDVGPVITSAAADALNEHISDMGMRGFVRHQITYPGESMGNYVQPTLIEIPSISLLKKEHFGPVLHVVRFSASNIDGVIDGINATGYGLTFGIHTRIEARAAYVSERIGAGNVYVNRNIIGAVVGSQPFGGQRYSGTGPKAGGPSYLQRFAVEKVVTANTVATGGNAELLNLVG